MAAPARLVVAEPYLGDIGFERSQAGDRASVSQAALETPDAIRGATADADAIIQEAIQSDIGN